MHATVHPVDGIPGPQDNSWVDAVLTALRRRAVPAGSLVAGPIALEPGCVIALWDDEQDATTDGFTAGPVTVGPGVGYEVTDRKAGPSAGPAHYLQVTTFSGRSEDWLAAYDRSGEERIWPAVKDIPGGVETVVGATGGGRVTAVLAESVEALQDATAAIMTTELLPWENPAHLPGPDASQVLRLLHADLPVGATR
jgi:hypothetical protein